MSEMTGIKISEMIEINLSEIIAIMLICLCILHQSCMAANCPILGGLGSICTSLRGS